MYEGVAYYQLRRHQAIFYIDIAPLSLSRFSLANVQIFQVNKTRFLEYLIVQRNAYIESI